MSRKPNENKPPSNFPRRTAVELAECLGVHRNTIAAWRSEGAPTNLDEFSWRAWAAARQATGRGYDCPRDPEPELLDLLANANVGDYRQRRAKHQPVLGVGDPPDLTQPAADKTPPPKTPEERKAEADAQIAEVKARDAKADSDRRNNRLVHVDDLNPLLDAWLQVLHDVVFVGLVQTPDLITASPDLRAQLRGALEKRLHDLRLQLASETEARLESYLLGLATGAA